MLIPFPSFLLATLVSGKCCISRYKSFIPQPDAANLQCCPFVSPRKHISGCGQISFQILNIRGKNHLILPLQFTPDLIGMSLQLIVIFPKF